MREKLSLGSQFPLPTLGFVEVCPFLVEVFSTVMVACPLSRGGFSSSSSSLVTKCSILSPIQTPIETHLHQTLKTPLSPSLHHLPPTSPKQQLTTSSPLRRSKPWPDLFTQTLRAATKPLFTAVLPSTHVLFASDFLFLSRALPSAEAPHHTLLIVLLPAPLRPLPKPPPSLRVSILVSLPSLKSFVAQTVVPPAQRLLPLRPPPKPSWLLRLFIAFLVWYVVYGVSMRLWIQVFVFVLLG